MSETVAEKACRYLCEGRVRVLTVTPELVEAEVRGNGKTPYRTRREAGRSPSCTCPAWHRECAHVQAVRLVT